MVTGDFNGIGTDIAGSWSFDENGDLNIVSNKENLAQAISNRLGTDLDSLNLFYANYGSVLGRFLGWRRNQRTLDFMKIEVENRLVADFRLKDFRVECEYLDDGGVGVNVTVRLDDDEVFTNELVLSKEGVDVIGD